MKKQFTLLSLGLALTGYNLGFAQETKIQPCYTDEVMEQHFAADPAARAAFEAEQKSFRENFYKPSDQTAGRTAATVYTVPVVFHILHTGGPENIPDATCIAALKQINEDYARQGADTASIVTQFKNLYINSDITFMLAKKDPSGNCINGIVRHYDTKTNWQQPLAAASPTYYPYTWDPTRYLNVYIVANIVPQGTVTNNGIIVGYTYIPGTWPTGNGRDAIIYRYNYLSVAPAGYDARSLSHEMGHWLGLSHTFGSTNNPGIACGDDGLNDTPVTKGNFSACPPTSTNPAFTCSSPDPNNTSLYYQNVQNFMDYSNCAKNFTTDQTNWMRGRLGSTVSGRSNVVSASNLSSSFTDVNGSGLCAPIAEFLSYNNSYTICAGGSIQMKDYSGNGTIDTWQWAADNGGVVATPSASNTNITFNTPGTSVVSLTVANAQGQSTQMRTVTVLTNAASITGPYMESFENPGLPTDWSTSSIPAGTTWDQTNDAALDGDYSYKINGPTAAAGQIGILQMPILDLLNNPGSKLSFVYAYARQTSTQNDVLKVQFSSDCGGSWTDVVSLSANTMQLGSGGITTSSYVPSSTSEWKLVDLSTVPSWNLFTSSASVFVRFNFTEGTPGHGNNIYIDAINFSTATGVNELTKSVKLSLYPNPSTGESNLKFTLSESASVKVEVVDILGKQVSAAAEYNFGSGEHTVLVNKDNTLKKGVYFVNMSLNGAKMSRKLIIN